MVRIWLGYGFKELGNTVGACCRVVDVSGMRIEEKPNGDEIRGNCIVLVGASNDKLLANKVLAVKRREVTLLTKVDGILSYSWLFVALTNGRKGKAVMAGGGKSHIIGISVDEQVTERKGKVKQKKN